MCTEKNYSSTDRANASKWWSYSGELLETELGTTLQRGQAGAPVGGTAAMLNNVMLVQWKVECIVQELLVAFALPFAFSLFFFSKAFHRSFLGALFGSRSIFSFAFVSAGMWSSRQSENLLTFTAGSSSGSLRSEAMRGSLFVWFL